MVPFLFLAFLTKKPCVFIEKLVCWTDSLGYCSEGGMLGGLSMQTLKRKLEHFNPALGGGEGTSTLLPSIPGTLPSHLLLFPQYIRWMPDERSSPFLPAFKSLWGCNPTFIAGDVFETTWKGQVSTIKRRWCLDFQKGAVKRWGGGGSSWVHM